MRLSAPLWRAPRHRSVRRVRCLLSLALLSLAASIAAAQDSANVLVFGAASLTDVLNDLDAAYDAANHADVKASFAASSVLAKQIEAGAPADVFFSADLDWMDYLEQRHLLRPGSRQDVVGNRLVLIARAESKLRLKLVPGVDLGAALGHHRPHPANQDAEAAEIGEAAQRVGHDDARALAQRIGR